VDDEEIFALTRKLVTIKLAIAMVILFGWDFYQMDVNNTFLNGGLEEEGYIY
jgi:uncharacterized membrane protein